MAKSRLNDDAEYVGSNVRAFIGPDDMRRWCAEKNRRSEERGHTSWLYVEQAARDDGSKFFKIVELRGWRATEVRDFLKGALPHPMNWADIDVKKLHASLRYKARMGLEVDELLPGIAA